MIYQEVISQLFLILITSSSLTALSYFLLKRYLVSEIENSIRNKYDSKLEKLKGDISTSQSILIHSIASQNEGIKITQERKVMALEKYWRAILEVEGSASYLKFIEDILTIDEIEIIDLDSSKFSEPFKSTLKELMKNIDPDRISKLILNNRNELEISRIYLGERLWVYLHLFNQVFARISNQYISNYKSSKPIIHWTKDTFLTNSINRVLNQQEKEFVFNSNTGGLERLISLFKEKMLSEISKATTGELAAESSFKNALKMNAFFDEENKIEREKAFTSK